MSIQHTPGPWEVQAPMDEELCVVEAGKQAYEWRFIAACPFPSERGDISRKQVEANAHLIAAAPTMLEALQAARQFIANGIEFGFIRMPDADTPDSAHGTLPMIDAAITAATPTTLPTEARHG